MQLQNWNREKEAADAETAKVEAEKLKRPWDDELANA